MNRGEFQTSLVQQMIWSSGTATGSGGHTTTSSSNIVMSSLKPCHEDQEASPNNLPSLSSPSMLFSQQQFPHTSSGQLAHMNGGGAAAGSLPSSMMHDGGGGGQENHHMPESWSQMLL
jgi:hypothetical protein